MQNNIRRQRTLPHTWTKAPPPRAEAQIERPRILRFTRSSQPLAR